MIVSEPDWQPDRSDFATTLLQVLAGLTASLLLFALVAWTIRDNHPSATDSQTVNSLNYAPPPPPPIEQTSNDTTQSPTTPSSKPIRFERETFVFELQSLDVNFDPQQTIDTLAKLEVDISKMAMSRSDIQDLVVYERRELDRSLQPLFQQMPTIRKQTKGDNFVRLIFVVDEHGKVTDEIYILESTDPEINEDIIAGVKTWTFEPPTRNRKKVRAKGKIRINISPNNPSPWGNL